MGREDVLKRVREAEGHVSQMLEEAQRESESRLSGARREADRLVREGLSAVDKEADAIFLGAREETRKKAEAQLKEGRTKIDASKQASEARLTKAVDTLIDDFKHSVMEG
jgi:V/A-type H+-transporting ATPase subunit G/H